MTTMARARAALEARFGILYAATTSSQGYTSCPRDNLMRGMPWLHIEDDLRRGDGRELDRKFRAVHSSAALVVNCFGPFKTRPHSLLLCGKVGARSVEFERRLPTPLRGTPPNLDAWIDRGGEVVAVESKLLE